MFFAFPTKKLQLFQAAKGRQGIGSKQNGSINIIPVTGACAEC